MNVARAITPQVCDAKHMFWRPNVMCGVQNFARVIAIVRRSKSTKISYDGRHGWCVICETAAMAGVRGDGSHRSGSLKLARQL